MDCFSRRRWGNLLRIGLGMVDYLLSLLSRPEKDFRHCKETGERVHRFPGSNGIHV